MKKLFKMRKNSMTLQEILKEVNKHKDYFLSQVKENHHITYLNGFVGAGALIKPRDHFTIGINTIFLYGCGFNKDGSEIEKHIKLFGTVEEMEDVIEVLQVCIERYKERKIPKIEIKKKSDENWIVYNGKLSRNAKKERRKKWLKNICKQSI